MMAAAVAPATAVLTTDVTTAAAMLAAALMATTAAVIELGMVAVAAVMSLPRMVNFKARIIAPAISPTPSPTV